MTRVAGRSRRFSRLAVNLGPPPAHADKQETPVVKELRLFALERVAYELERPSHKEKQKRIKPQPANEDASEEQGERKENCRYPQGMAYAVYWVLMAAGILRDPLFVGAAAKHGDLMIHGSNRKVVGRMCRVERPSGGVLAS